MNADASRILSEYRTATEQLISLFRKGDSLIDVEEMQAALATRDELIRQWETLGQREPLGEQELAQAEQIRELDRQVMEAVNQLMLSTQQELVQFRNRQRGLDQYMDHHSVDAFFIDSKK